MEYIIQGVKYMGLRDRGSKESYQEVAGNLLMEEQNVRTFS